MIRRPPRSTLFPYTDALPISLSRGCGGRGGARAARGGRGAHRPAHPLVERSLWAAGRRRLVDAARDQAGDRKSTRLNSSHGYISYAVFCFEKKTNSV